MSQNPVTVIINPASSSGRGGRVAPKLIEALTDADIPHQVFRTNAPGHGVELGRQAAAGPARQLVVVGGDGTIHEVATGLIEGGGDLPAMAVFPVGTGNDFYRMVGAGKTEGDVIGLLREGRIARFDVGRVEWNGGHRVFVNLLGIGVDVEVLRRRAGFTRLRGLSQYLAALVTALARFRPPGVEIEVGEHRITGRTTLSAITVGPSIGGGFMLSPEASPSDGHLDLCHFPSMGLLKIMGLIPRVIRGTHGTAREVTTCRLQEAVLRSTGDEPLWFEIDGELGPEPAHELRVEVLPGVLPVLVPAHA
ncbi:MAG: diacylglycerol kinase family lipid kinase [Gemmatimonadetes bacterium]|nr:diacylglycerol kinase family lipid kinase [Gemmatimonadota bacterium]